MEYIKQICFESTGFLPVYYYIHLSKLNTHAVIEIINGVVSRSPAKAKLLERLSGRKKERPTLFNTDTNASKRKKVFINQFKKEQLDNELNIKDLEYCLQAIRGLTTNELQQHSVYIRELLKTWFNKYYSCDPGNIVNNLRRTICWVDETLFMDGII